MLSRLSARRIVEQAFGGAVGVEDAAGGVGDEEAERHGFDEAVEAVFGGAECALGGELFAAVVGFPELALDGGDEACEVLLGDVILGAGAHGFDRGGLAHGAGEHDEGDVEAAGFGGSAALRAR